MDHLNRNPVSNYGEALSWLFAHSDVAEWAFDPDPRLPNEANLVADMFWVTPEQLIKDLRKLWNDACGAGPVWSSGYKRAGYY